MHKRKTLAVIMGHCLSDWHKAFLDGIISQAKELDYDVAIFSLFTVQDEYTSYQRGEENIFNLINYAEISGIVFFETTAWAERLNKRIIADLRSKSNGNVVFIDSASSQGYPNVISYDRESFKNMTDHVIDVHGLKKIYCLTGFKGNFIAEMRINGYKDSLINHGIEVKSEYCFYGDFWQNDAIKFAKKIINGEIERPEAVVCGSDMMALTLCNTLINNGIKVPEDIVIVGYDLTNDGYENIPSITSCMRPDRSTGARAVCILNRKITGHDVKPHYPAEGLFVRGESCGCKKTAEFVKFYGASKRAQNEYQEKFFSGNMQENIMCSQNYDELMENSARMVYMLRGCVRYSLCLNENWNEFSENDDVYIRDGYSERMTVAMTRSGDEIKCGNEKFKSSDMFPPDMLEEDRPVACYFTPLHFGDRCFGYGVVKYEAPDIVPDIMYSYWTSNINTAIEFIRVRERMAIMYNKVYTGSLRDSMTGIYNRRGYEKFATEIFNKARNEKKKLLIAIADLDNLKIINDTYGHSEGDNALTVLAQALQSCSGNSESCARTGGDEFAIVGCYDYLDDSIEYYCNRIRGYLLRYNTNSGKRYNVETSLGFFCDYTDDYSSFEACVKIADERMYEDKAARKKGRKSNNTA